jgi:hypothetical protein
LIQHTRLLGAAVTARIVHLKVYARDHERRPVRCSSI